jgi:hypothetical protein
LESDIAQTQTTDDTVLAEEAMVTPMKNPYESACARNMGLGLSSLQTSMGTTPLLKMDEAHEVQGKMFQVFIKKEREVGAFRVRGLNDLWKSIETR